MSFSGFRTSTSRIFHSVGVSRTSAPSRVTRRLPRSTVKASVVTTASLLRFDAAAQQRAEPGQELVQAERFGDVVIRAGVESLDFVLGAVPGGKHQDRRRC